MNLGQLIEKYRTASGLIVSDFISAFNSWSPDQKMTSEELSIIEQTETGAIDLLLPLDYPILCIIFRSYLGDNFNEEEFNLAWKNAEIGFVGEEQDDSNAVNGKVVAYLSEEEIRLIYYLREKQISSEYAQQMISNAVA